jgi:hypothetical protein
MIDYLTSRVDVKRVDQFLSYNNDYLYAMMSSALDVVHWVYDVHEFFEVTDVFRCES